MKGSRDQPCPDDGRSKGNFRINAISKYFDKYSKEEDHNKLLKGLCSLEGIAITIGTGLIWSTNRNTRVPFDKYTATYASKLGLLLTDKVSTNYIKYSEKIVKYCKDFEIQGRNYEIEDFVREAMHEMEDSEFYIELK